MQRIRVLVVDDSALVRKILTRLLETDHRIQVVGTAADPYIARDKIKQLNPDVLTLDVEMPRMDGITFLENLMRLRPMPVVMISSLTERGAEVTLQALELGAIDFITKPQNDISGTLEDYAREIIAKVITAAAAKVRAHTAVRTAPQRRSADAVLPRRAGQGTRQSSEHLIAVGASTGGTEAIKEVLMAMPPDAPGMVITQHIPAAFSAPFAARMNSLSAMSVAEARDGEQILPGHAYIAPGDRHLMVERNGSRFVCRLNDGPPVNRHRPSVDVLFRSVAQSIGKYAHGVLLTGMGEDGARGLLEMRGAGAATAAQDEATSVVWGMPGAAVRLGAAGCQLALRDVAAWLLNEESGASVRAAP